MTFAEAFVQVVGFALIGLVAWWLVGPEGEGE